MKAASRIELASRLMIGTFVARYVRELSWLQHNVDEGSNACAASLIQHGLAPFRDSL